MTRGARFLAGVLAAGVPAAHAETDGWRREWHADVSASSQLFSLGSVRADHAVWMMEGDVVQRLSGFGHVLFGYWALSDIERRGGSGHRSSVYESDPYLFYGYDWDFAEGWGLRNRLGMIWIFNEGYALDVVHLIREWTWAGELASPWLAFFAQSRVVDGRGTYVRAGARRSFVLADGAVSVMPHVAMSGGSERWNRKRYGDYPGTCPLSQGMNAVDYGVRVSLPLAWGACLYADVCGFNAFDHAARAQIGESRRRGTTRKTDAFFVASGVSWEF